MEYTEALEKAMKWAQANKPASSLQHKTAFANSVAYLITGAPGGFGGPSLREHLVSWSLGTVGSTELAGQAMTTITPGDLPMPGQWKFDEAIAHADPICFEPAAKFRNRLIQIQEREHCFDDDPADLAALRGKSV